ncbi:MAG: ribbon-helix-helix protein, CopG family [Pseudomonadota bacterium]
MQVSLRVPPETSEQLESLAEKTGKTKTALILEALKEKYELVKDRTQLVRDLAGWMPVEECDALRTAVAEFDAVDDEDWQ